MIFKGKLIVVFVFLFAIIGRSQTINLSDSIYHVLSNKPVFSFKFDTRNSFITGNGAKVYGIKVGMCYGKRLTLGVGYNFIGTDLREYWVVGRDQYFGEIKMRYVAPFAEYSFYKKGNWEAVIPVQVGVGKSFVMFNHNGVSEKIKRDNVILYEPGMSVEYKILKLFGVGCGVGYRIMLKNNRELDQQFTSPVYVLRIRLIFDELYKRAQQLKKNEED